MAASISKHRGASPIPAVRRTRICRHQKTRSHEFHPRQLSSLRLDQHQALHLLLGRSASLIQNFSPRPFQKLTLPCVHGSVVLGTCASPPRTKAWSLALPVAPTHLSHDLLLRLPSPQIPSPYRTRARHFDRLYPD